MFSEGEWKLLRTVADGLEWSYGWQPGAAQRLRFVIDFSYSTGLRAGELVHATLGSIEVDTHGDHWLHVVGKGSKSGKVVLPGMARGVLDRQLAQRGLPVSPAKWNPATPLVGNLDGEAGITSKRLWAIVKRFFATAADVLAEANPALAGNTALDAPYARDSRAAAQRRTHDRAGQPAARVALHDFDVPALGRRSPGKADRRGVRSACDVKRCGGPWRVNLHRKHEAPRGGGLQVLVAIDVSSGQRVNLPEKYHYPMDEAGKLNDEMESMHLRSGEATAKGGQAYARLLTLAETRNSGQIPRIAKFFAATYNGEAFPFDLFELRALDIEISDDMVLCIDALRWGRADLYSLIPDGDKRVKAVIELWGLKWPESL